jgi:hypothetical protein
MHRCATAADRGRLGCMDQRAPRMPSSAERRSGLLAGLALIAVGSFLLVVQAIPDAGRLVPLGLGIVFLVAGVARRVYGFVVPGGILTGVGLGVALSGWLPAAPAGGLVLLSMAAGFLSIWVIGSALRLPENHWWPFIPGTVLGIVGLAVLGGDAFVELLRWWPLALIVIGVAIVATALLRRDPGR